MSSSKPRNAYVTRTATFCASHRLHLETLSPAENEQQFGLCTHLHGHFYSVELFFGRVHPFNGTVISVEDVEECMEKVISARLEGRHLHLLKFFKAYPSTAENIALFIWQGMRGVMEHPELLHKIRLYESETSFVTFRG